MAMAGCGVDEPPPEALDVQGVQMPAKAGPPSLREDLLAGLSQVRDKYLGLAEAVPESQYAWRPGEGVRSVSEVYMHIAMANIGIAMRATGAPVADNVDPAWYGAEAKTITAKETILEALAASFDYVAQAIEATSNAQMAETVEMFGGEYTVRRALLLLMTHGHEHLGQSIAYARVNGVAPPWSAGG